MKLLALVAVLPLVLGACSSVTADQTPVPDSLGPRFESVGHDIGNSVDTLEYVFLNTNSALPPYDSFGEQTTRDLATIVQTLDAHFLSYDWEDPYVD